jgi:hypothetical protein
MTSLVTLLTLTSALLLALAPPPLAAENYDSLSAGMKTQYLDDVFKTAVAAHANQWKYIYIHHSQTAAGDSTSLAIPKQGVADHFILGNGNGCQDGEIQMSPRWDQQQSAAAPAGVDDISPDCISICVVGDFDKTMPTSTQLNRLTALVTTLQSQLRIAGDHIVILNQPGQSSGLGKYFPTTAFKSQILQ